jgi:hypothetical protein
MLPLVNVLFKLVCLLSYVCFGVSHSQIYALLLDAPAGWYVHDIAGQRLISGAAAFSIRFWCLSPQSSRCQSWTNSRTCCFVCLICLFWCLSLSNLLFAFGLTHNLVHVIAGERLIFEIGVSYASRVCLVPLTHKLSLCYWIHPQSGT